MAKDANLSRRNLLLGSVAGVLAIGAGGATWVALADPEKMVGEIVRQALPGVTIEPVTFKKFTHDFMREMHHMHEHDPNEAMISRVKWHATRVAQSVIGLGNLERIGPFGPQIEDVRRMALTRYLIQSNFFFEDDPKAQPIVYSHFTSPPPCRNPWADVSPPK